MFCSIMLTVLEALSVNLSAWCTVRYTTLAKSWILAFFILVVYVLILLIAKISLWTCKRFDNDMFIQLYNAVRDNDTAKSICILDSFPSYTNKFKYPDGYTPFMIACANANTQLVRYMLQKGANLELKSKSDETPLYLAAFYYIQHKDCKNATCIRELYYAGANINQLSKNNIAVVQMAAIFGHTSLVKWLIVKGANLNVYPHPFLLAKSQGHQEAASLIAQSMKIKRLLY